MIKGVRGLTGMRGFASLYVLFFHLSTAGLFTIPILHQIQLAGFSGVDFFFVLSGYLLYSLYSPTGLNKAYFIRRVFRTFPLYYLVLPLYSMTNLLPNTLLVFVYAQNYLPSTFIISPLWTLCIEELFYFAILPLIILLKLQKKYILAIGVAVNLGSVVFLPETPFFNWQLSTFFVSYAIGICFSGLKFSPTIQSKIAVGAGFGALLEIYPLLYHYALQSMGFSLIYGFVILTFQQSRIFTNRLMVGFGMISYGIYVLQIPVLLIYRLVFGMALTITLAVGSYLLLENPFVTFGRQIFKAKGRNEVNLLNEIHVLRLFETCDRFFSRNLIHK